MEGPCSPVSLAPPPRCRACLPACLPGACQALEAAQAAGQATDSEVMAETLEGQGQLASALEAIQKANRWGPSSKPQLLASVFASVPLHPKP